MRVRGAGLALALLLTAGAAGSAVGAGAADWMSGLPRQSVQVRSWPGGKKVAVCFVLYVEDWGVGQGPNFRSDMTSRDPDIVNESFRRYAIDFGVERVGRVFREAGAPLSIALNAQFPERHMDTWRRFRALVPDAAIVAHGINNSTQLLPLAGGMEAQKAYVRRTLDAIARDTGVRPQGWSSPSVYPNADTFAATAAEGVTYTLDGMDTDTLSRLATPSGPLLLIPYPPTTVDMGQYLTRGLEPADLERLWIDYVGELVSEAEADPGAEATVVAIGLHPFVVGTPAGAAALRRVLSALSREKLVWITDVAAVAAAAR
jgi:peptidoglycan/xylan/chitin deacetylase (PgdA/CDA1 family)